MPAASKKRVWKMLPKKMQQAIKRTCVAYGISFLEEREEDDNWEDTSITWLAVYCYELGRKDASN